MNNEIDIVMEEMNLNIENQIGKIKEPTIIGYQPDKNTSMLGILFPKKLLKIMNGVSNSDTDERRFRKK